MVKIGRLWGDATFSGLSPNSKLLYLYLCTQPSISTLGVVRLSEQKIMLDLGFVMMDLLPCYEELYPYVVICIEDTTGTYIVKDHFKSLAKSKSNIRKAITEANQSGEELKKIFKSIFVKEDFEDNSFKPPTPEEVSSYALSKGHVVNGKAFCQWYEDNDWYDKNNKKVRRWKAKVDKVWSKEENKLTKVEGAPKGYEYFYVETENGDWIFPDSWKDGKPRSKNFLQEEILINEFDKWQEKD